MSELTPEQLIEGNANAETQIRSALAHTGGELNAEFPVLSAVVVSCFQGMGYTIDLETLHSWLAAGDLTPPERDSSGCHRWGALQMYCVWKLLEARRMWQPFSPFHALKKSASQIQFEELDGSELPEDMARAVNRPLRDLLILMAETESRALRENILAHIFYKLEQEA